MRRSRLSMEGRDWKCKFCQKGYLKMESLVHHIKLKHWASKGADRLIQTLRMNSRMAKRKRDKESGRNEEEDSETDIEDCIETQTTEMLDRVKGGPVNPLEKFEAVYSIVYLQAPPSG